ncbi:MAG TPA: DUF2849 domain-containing protein [Paracoccus sp. (in: a-proteobacteria)]|nr:DUF2849 domain-containing protein [Paracoccus sp. (in: a-proteobacteria)]
MSKTFVPSEKTPAVLTANDLRNGRCVWMSASGWTTDPKAATLYEDANLADFALLDAQAQAHVVVGPYLIEATRDAHGRPAPAHFREAFRQRGPSTENVVRNAAPAGVSHV